MRPATDTIHAPPFPRSLPWINTEALRIDKQLGRPLVMAFWDARRAVSLRPLLELERWHRDYAPRGARVIAVHVDGDASGIDEDGVRAAAERLGLTMPIVLDTDLLIADAYGLRGVPSRYIFDQALKLADAHFGLGGLADGESLLRALVEHGERSLEARRAEGKAAATVQAAVPASEPEVDEGCDQGASVPAAKQPRLLVHAPAREDLPAPLDDPAPFVAPEPGELLPGDFRGAYAAGGVWLQLRGTGTVSVDGRPEPITVDGEGAYLALESGLHAPGTLSFALSDGVVCDGVQLEPGVSAID